MDILSYLLGKKASGGGGGGSTTDVGNLDVVMTTPNSSQTDWKIGVTEMPSSNFYAFSSMVYYMTFDPSSYLNMGIFGPNYSEIGLAQYDENNSAILFTDSNNVLYSIGVIIDPETGNELVHVEKL